MAKTESQNEQTPEIASQQQNASLKHSADGVTTRDDALDLGVPMLPGDPNEPVGPEDALGEGPTRGDYSERLGESNYRPHQTVPVQNPEPGGPTVRVINQRNNVQQGEIAGKKGGVETAGEQA